MNLAEFRKAILAGATALIGTLTAAASDGTVTVTEVIIVAVSTIVAGLGTYQIPNKETVE